MTNNDILKKLRVALMLRDSDIEAIMSLVDFKISTSELGALFRTEDHPKYIECGDQILRNFLNGLIIYTRGTKEFPKNPAEALRQKPVMAKAKNESDAEKASATPTPKKPATAKSAKSFGQKKPFKKPFKKVKYVSDLSPVAYKNKKKS